MVAETRNPQDLRQWVCWQLETRDGKPTKVPYSPTTRERASSTDPKTWASHSEAVRACRERSYSGVGFVFTAEDDFAGADLDRCLDPETGEVEAWAQEIIEELNSYTEISPSGVGLHILVRGQIPPGRNRKGRIEIYDRGRYFTMTGRHLAGTPRTIESRQEQLKRVVQSALGELESPNGHKTLTPDFVSELSEEEIIEKASAADNGEKFRRLWSGDASGYASSSEADVALCSLLAFWTGPDPGRIDGLFSRSGLCREKWTRREDYRRRTIARALEGRTEFYRPGNAITLADGLERMREELEPEEIGILLSEVAPEEVRWLWESWLALGKLALVDGDPGLGKSAMTLDLAARVSAGHSFPDGAPPCEPAGVVLLSAEDGLADTIRPRLDAAGADVPRVLSLATVPDNNGQERLLSIPEDIPLIEKGIERVGARLVVVDPLMAFLSADANSHRDQDVRRALAPLAGLAERTGACVLVVRHLNKAPGNNPLYRGGGSIGIIGAARMGYLIAKDPQDEKRRVLASTKNNLARPPKSLMFTLEESGGGAVRINWLGESEVSAKDLLATPQDNEQSDARSEAAEFLQDVLSERAVPASEVFQDAEDARIAEKTLRRAKKLLGVVAYRENSAGEQRGSGRWMWKLPVVDLSTEDDQGDAPAVQDGQVSQAESGGHLEHDGGTGTREYRKDTADFQDVHPDLLDGLNVQDGQDGQRLETGSLEQEEPEILREPTGTPQLHSDEWEEI